MNRGHDTRDALSAARSRNSVEWTQRETTNRGTYYVNERLKIVSWNKPGVGESQFISKLQQELVGFNLPSYTGMADNYFMGSEDTRLFRNVTIIDNVDSPDSQAERTKLTDAFESRGFSVGQPKKKMDSLTMMSTLEGMARSSTLSRHSCSVLIVFGIQSKKSRERIRCSDGKYIDVEDIVEPFRGAKFLLGKPKLFIFRTFEDPVESDTIAEPPSVEVQDKEVPRRRIPLWADALCVFCPTTDGTDKHTFVEKFCDEIDNKKGQRDILDAIRRANLVALAEWKPDVKRAPKVASVEFTLTKKWHLPSPVST